MSQSKVAKKGKAGKKNIARPQVSKRGLQMAPVALGAPRVRVYQRSAAPTKPGACVRYVGCDYVGAISAASGAQDNVYGISAASGTSFPRLSAIAAVYELYSFSKLRFIMAGKAASTVAGDMTGVMQYSVDQSTGFTAAQIRNEEDQVTCKFWESREVIADPKRASRPWFLTGVGHSDESQDGYLGSFHLFTDAASAIPVVDLFVEYDVEFAQGEASGAPELTPELQIVLSKDGGRKFLQKICEAALNSKERELCTIRRQLLRKVVPDRGDVLDEQLSLFLDKVDAMPKPQVSEGRIAASGQAVPAQGCSTASAPCAAREMSVLQSAVLDREGRESFPAEYVTRSRRLA